MFLEKIDAPDVTAQRVERLVTADLGDLNTGAPDSAALVRKPARSECLE
jgi:hypothetical protein